MSDTEALKYFSRQPVNQDMVNYLVSTTNSIIQVKPPKSKFSSMNSSDLLVSPIGKKNVSLYNFIKNLIKYSNVQTPTLMATLIYLNKLRNLLPANAVGMETTRHRIFLAALILSAKSLNDSSPLNKHWTRYTDGLLTIDEVNMAERELIGLLKWNVVIKEDDLIIALQPFLIPIKEHMIKKLTIENNQKINYYRLSTKPSVNTSHSPRSVASSNYSLSSIKSRSSSTSSINSYNSLNSSPSSVSIESNSSDHNYNLSHFVQQEQANKKFNYRPPLQSKSINSLNRHSSQKFEDLNLVNSGRIIA